MAAAGKVCTGFSKPWVALYSASAGVVTYSGARQLARGVSVSLNPEEADSNDFYADNVEAESVAGTFSGGTVDLVVDGLLQDAEKMIMGLPAATEVAGVSVLAYGDDAQPPYVGIGYIARYMSEGVTTYTPTILTKAKFNIPGAEHATQEENISWQTQALSAALMRDDTAKHNWKYVAAEDYSTEKDAEDALKAILGVTP